jgi:uncharacterized membrane protein YjjP (DUF1212 family)
MAFEIEQDSPVTIIDRIQPPIVPAVPPPADDADCAFLLRLGAALHRFGVPAHRLEEAMAGAARRLHLRGQFFATPTALQAAFSTAAGERTFLLRVEPGDTDLERLAAVDRLLGRFVSGAIGAAAAEAELAAVLAAPPRYRSWLQVACFAVASAAAARFFGGSGIDVGAAGLLGLLIGLLAQAGVRRPGTAPLFEAAAGCLAAFLAGVLAASGVSLAPPIVVVSGLIVLVPGLQITTAMIEVATRHLSSGSARLVGAFVALCSIGFGVALGTKLAALACGAPPPVLAPVPLPAWTEALALLIAPLAFAVILRAAPRDLPLLVFASGLAFFGARAGAGVLGPELGAMLGAFLVAAASNALARARNRPVSLTLVPGLLMLVPGALGFRSLTSLFADDVLGGVRSGVTMLLIAMALVTGLLLAQAVVPPRRAL